MLANGPVQMLPSVREYMSSAFTATRGLWHEFTLWHASVV
jgi:hypothetical protein